MPYYVVHRTNSYFPWHALRNCPSGGILTRVLVFPLIRVVGDHHAGLIAVVIIRNQSHDRDITRGSSTQ